jgi:hypothetical protein
MCLARRLLDSDHVRMARKAPIYRRTCRECDRPALTLDHSGDPYCAEHADVFIAIEDAPDGLGEAEITVLLTHRSRVTEVG